MVKTALGTLFVGILFLHQQVSADIAPSKVFSQGITPGGMTLPDPSLELGQAFEREMALPGSSSLTSAGFDSPLDAVIAASERYNAVSIEEDREFMGAILHRHSQYHYTVAQGEAGEDRITVRVPVPKGANIVAFWHTHGSEAHAREYFSEVDTQLATDWDKPFYLADHTGVLKVYEPGASTLASAEARSLGLPARRGFAKGKKVVAANGKIVKVTTGQTTQTMLCEAETNNDG